MSEPDRGARSKESVPPRPSRPIEELRRDLIRLDDELDRLRTSEGYARHHHRESTQLAYDDVLLDCARALEVPVPRAPLDDATRRDLEIALNRAGLHW